MIFSKIKNFILENKKVILFAIFSFFLFSFDNTFADGESNVIKEANNVFIWFLQLLIILFTSFIGLISMLISWFISPEWITWSYLWIDEKLKDIWILVSNVVYFAFAFLLIWIAFMNIVWNEWTWEMKKSLPKFIVWVLIVPFSRFFVQLMVSIASVLTVTVLTLPSDSFEDYTKNLSKHKLYSEYNVNFGNLWKSMNSSTKSSASDFAKEVFRHSENAKERSFEDIMANNPFWIINIYTYGIMHPDQLDNFTKSNWKFDLKNAAQLLQKWLFDILLAIVYFIFLITLWMVLLIRWVWLWIFMMFSPLFWLVYFFDWKNILWDKFWIKSFINLTLIPVYVAWVLSFWLLFLVTLWEWITAWNSNWQLSLEVKDKISSIEIWKGTEWSVKFNFSWLWKETSEIAGWINNWIDYWKGLIWKLILQIMWIVIIWVWLIAAMKSSKITETIVQPIEQFWKSVWWLAAKAPTYMPVFGGKSATELGQAASTLKSNIDSHYTWQWSKLWTSFTPEFARWPASDMNMVNSRYKTDQMSDEWVVNKYIWEMWKYINDLNVVLKDSWKNSEFMRMMKTIFWDKVYNKIKDIKDEDKLWTALLKINDTDITTAWGKEYFKKHINWKSNLNVDELFEWWSVESISAKAPKLNTIVQNINFSNLKTNEIVKKWKIKDNSKKSLVNNIVTELKWIDKNNLKVNELVNELVYKLKQDNNLNNLNENELKEIAESVYDKIKET